MDIYEKIKTKLSKDRFLHTLGVRDAALALAKRMGADVEKTELAALLHDYAKELNLSTQIKIAKEQNLITSEFDLLGPQVLHGPVGAFLVREELQVKDQEVLKAIASHTLGNNDMSLLDKIIFISDMIEPNRTFLGVDELRDLVVRDFDKALIQAFDNTIRYLIEKKQVIHPQTVLSRNGLLGQK